MIFCSLTHLLTKTKNRKYLNTYPYLSISLITQLIRLLLIFSPSHIYHFFPYLLLSSSRLSRGLHDELLAGDALVHVEHVVDGGLKVSGSVEGLADEDLAGLPVVDRLVEVRDGHELLIDLAEELNCRGELLDGVVGLDGGGDDGDPLALGADHVVGAHDADVDVRLALDLLLGDDDLAALGAVGAVDGVREDADEAHDRAHLLDAVGEVRGVADDELALGDGVALLGRLDADARAGLVVDKAADGGVEHVGPAVDGREARKALGELAEAVEGVDVRGLRVAGERLKVQLRLVDRLEGGLLDVRVVAVEGDGVPDEVDRVGLEAVLLVELVHRHLREVEAAVGRGLVVLVLADVLEELGAAALLEEGHQGRLESVRVRHGDLVDLPPAEDVAASDGAELEVALHVGVDEHGHKTARGHDELGDNVHVVVAGLAEAFGGLGAALVLLEQLVEVEGGGGTTVVTIPI